MYVDPMLKGRRYSDELGARNACVIEQLRKGPGNRKIMALTTGTQSTIEYPPVFETYGLGAVTDYSLLDHQ